MIPKETINLVKDSNDIVLLVEEYVKLKKRGTNYFGLCPFHHEKTPSFSVSEEKQLFYCFGCASGGNIFDFLIKIKNISFIEAVEELANRAGIRLPKKKQSYKLLRLYEMQDEALNFFIENLKKSKKAREYLNNRGIDEKAIEQFKIGYAPNDWDGLLKYLKSKKYQTEEIIEIGLASKTKNNKIIDRFRNRVIFPIIDMHNRVIAFGGRRIKETDEPKYLNTSDTIIFKKGLNLFNINLAKQYIKEKRYAVIVEGYTDVIGLYINGLKNCCAVLGTALSKEHIKIIQRLGEKIVFIFDGDTAGINACKRAGEIAINEDIDIKVVILEKGLDPFDYVKKYRMANLKKLIDESKDFFEFLIDYYIEQYTPLNERNKKNIIDNLMVIIEKVEGPIKLDRIVKVLSLKLLIDEQILYSYIKNKKKSKSIENISEKEKKFELKITLEQTIVYWLLENTDKIKMLFSLIKKEEFEDKYCNIIIEAINKNSKEIASLEDIYKDLDESVKNYILKLIFLGKKEKFDIRENIFLFKKRNLKNRIKKISFLLKQNKTEKQRELLEKKIKLMKKLDKLNKVLNEEAYREWKIY